MLPLSSLSRYGVVTEGARQKIGFFLEPTFGFLPFLSAVEPLRAANRYGRQPLYSWHIVTTDGRAATACNGMQLPAEFKAGEEDELDMLFVCGAHDPNQLERKQTINWLRKLATTKITLGALDTGSYVLAEAGLLDDYRVTVHWENLPGMREAFPHLNISNALFEIDRKRWTCAGGTASMDMMLKLIEEQHGRDLTARIAELFIRETIRHDDDPQRMDLRTRTGVSHPKLLDCIALMESNVEQPLLPAELAEIIGVSKRQIERLFKRYLETTPSNFYLSVRLRAARRLLEQTTLPIIDVAMACGFSSPGHFSHRFRTHYGFSPRQARTVVARS